MNNISVPHTNRFLEVKQLPRARKNKFAICCGTTPLQRFKTNEMALEYMNDKSNHNDLFYMAQSASSSIQNTKPIIINCQ
jgi:hypothetical protein